MARTSGVLYPYTCIKKKIGLLERVVCFLQRRHCRRRSQFQRLWRWRQPAENLKIRKKIYFAFPLGKDFNILEYNENFLIRNHWSVFTETIRYQFSFVSSSNRVSTSGPRRQTPIQNLWGYPTWNFTHTDLIEKTKSVNNKSKICNQTQQPMEMDSSKL